MRIATSRGLLSLAASIAALSGAWVVSAQSPGDALERGFQNPPDSAKPRVWWHWMNGNIAKEGIQADMEWMKRVGIGGVQNFDAALSTPQVVEKRLVYMTPEWKDAFRFAANLADRLGLEMAIAGSPGWSESGGPWVPPAQAMKKFVWSETHVRGGEPFRGVLPKPPSSTGPFQNIGGRGAPGATAPPPEFYADSAVVAYPAPEGGVPMAGLQPKVTSSGGQFDLGSMTDGDLAKTTMLPAAPPNKKAWVQFEFAKPQTFRGLTIVAGGGRGVADPVLEASVDGQEFRVVAVVPNSRAPQRTIAFPATIARFFRVTFRTPAPSTANAAPLAAAGEIPIAELVLHTETPVHRFEDKAAFGLGTGLLDSCTPPVAAGGATPKAGVIDLTSKMRADGSLDWTPPPGRWIVVRLGYSLLGITNHPASPEATGLEVDKLNPAYVKNYFDNYLDQYKDATGGLMGARGLGFVVTDSWEAGPQNWTDDMFAEFRQRRGYDMHPWLPVLTGHVVESSEASDRFLYDFRRTLADLVAENHYDQLTTLLHARGMGRYSESHESGRAFIGDGMEVKRTADVPMSAMWTQLPGVNAEQYGYNADIRESASVAHIYGQNLVAAESMTASRGAWSWSPETLKPTADKELAMGLNCFVIHTSVHQPVNDKIPGLGLGPYGQWFTRHETWAEVAKPWVSYLARSSYMLQQGKFVADIAYYYGEDSNVTALFATHSPDVPAGYNFDYINSDALLHRLSVEGGRLTTPSGMSYRMLALDANARHMALPVLRKIRDLVNAGAVVVGPKPADTPSLSDDLAEFRAIADEVWGPDTGEHAFGKGRVYANQTLGDALAAIEAGPDFAYTKPGSDTNLLFVHRKLADGEIYWVDNRNPRAESLDATFRVAGKAAELWHADTGATEPASYRIEGDRTTVPLDLEPFGAVFVVFRKASATPSRTLPRQTETPLGALDGAWEVAFQADRGAPAKIALEKLGSWSESADTGVKYFSGTATYTKTFEAPAGWFQSGARLWLDLGEVKNIAEVSVNGEPLGVVWKAPFRAELTGALKPGANAVEIKVTNLWVNRLIGDQLSGAAKKYTYTTQPFYRADSPLLPSGLLGPVAVVRTESRQ
ncbi:MAG: glycosyl hydrolase [Bryobacteraceae bacterium]|jgi:hypothetical protein